MKIVHFIPSLGKGGAERVVCDLANKAVEEGHEVAIITWSPTPAELLTQPLRQEIELRYLALCGGRRGGAYFGILPWVLRNRRWLLSRDVVHCHLTMGSTFATAVQLIRLVLRGRTPAVIETYHAVGVAIPRFKRAVHAHLLKYRDAVAFMAEDSYWSRYRSARPTRLFRTIANGIAVPSPAVQRAVERYRRETAKIPDDAIVLGSVGRLMPERRPDLLLEVFVRLARRTDLDIHLLLAGDGSLRAKLEARVRRNGLKHRVHMPGLVLKPALAFGITDLYMTVNVGPTTGIAALEAASSGVPIIAVQLDQTYKGTASDWIWSSTDPQEVADRAAELLESPSQLKKLARKQQEHVERHHTVEVMAKAYYRLYGEALAARARGAAAKS